MRLFLVIMYTSTIKELNRLIVTRHNGDDNDYVDDKEIAKNDSEDILSIFLLFIALVNTKIHMYC